MGGRDWVSGRTVPDKRRWPGLPPAERGTPRARPAVHKSIHSRRPGPHIPEQSRPTTTEGVSQMSYTYEQHQQDVEYADANFRLAAVFESDDVRYVEAEADTGTRYSVTVAKLPIGAAVWAGAPIMVSVLSPWPCAYAMQPVGELHINYVAEKFAPRGTVNGGDLAALTLTIAHALRRKAVLS